MVALLAMALMLMAALVIIAAGFLGWQLSKLERGKPEADHGDEYQRDG